MGARLEAKEKGEFARKRVEDTLRIEFARTTPASSLTRDRSRRLVNNPG